MNDNNYHVYPENDTIEHIIEGVDCPCKVRLERYGKCLVIIHHALDGREVPEYWSSIHKDIIERMV